MSKLPLPRTPAFSGLLPEVPNAYALVPAQVEFLSSLYGQGHGQKLIRFNTEIPGYYRWFTADGCWFVKVLENEAAVRQAEAEEIAVWLMEQGVLTNHAQPKNGMMLGEYTAYAYPWQDGRYSRFSEADMGDLGKTLANLHRHLADYPQAAVVQQRADAREHGMAAIQQALACGDLKASPYPKALASLAVDVSLLPPGRPQVIHADLNPGNVLWSAAGELCILDFEDARHTYLSPLLDIAYVLERFVWVPHEDDATAQVCAQRFLNAYRENNVDPAFDADALWHTFLTLNLRALCLLAALEAEEKPVAAVEWQKFFDLSALHHHRRPLLQALDFCP